MLNIFLFIEDFNIQALAINKVKWQAIKQIVRQELLSVYQSKQRIKMLKMRQAENLLT